MEGNPKSSLPFWRGFDVGGGDPKWNSLLSCSERDLARVNKNGSETCDSGLRITGDENENPGGDEGGVGRVSGSGELEASEKAGSRDGARDGGEVGVKDGSLEYFSLKVGNVGSLARCLDGSGATLRRRPFEGGGEVGDHAGNRGGESVVGCDEDRVDR